MSGAVYHVDVRTIGKARGGSAVAAVGYIARVGRHATGHDPVWHLESGHMPLWARMGQGDPVARQYWSAADRYERTNGRLLKLVVVALPTALPLADQIELARGIANAITTGVDGGDLPWTLAVHGGVDSEGRSRNPHCHIAISERLNDGLARDPQQWFSRAAPISPLDPGAPPKRGARKTKALKPRRWLLLLREMVAVWINRALELAGVSVRVDHRSHAARGIERRPQPKLGPYASFLERHGVRTRRGDAVSEVVLSWTEAGLPRGPILAPRPTAVPNPGAEGPLMPSAVVSPDRNEPGVRAPKMSVESATAVPRPKLLGGEDNQLPAERHVLRPSVQGEVANVVRPLEKRITFSEPTPLSRAASIAGELIVERASPAPSGASISSVTPPARIETSAAPTKEAGPERAGPPQGQVAKPLSEVASSLVDRTSPPGAPWAARPAPASQQKARNGSLRSPKIYRPSPPGAIEPACLVVTNADHAVLGSDSDHASANDSSPALESVSIRGRHRVAPIPQGAGVRDLGSRIEISAESRHFGDVLLRLVLMKRWSTVHVQGPEHMRHAARIALSSARLRVFDYQSPEARAPDLNAAGGDAHLRNDASSELFGALDDLQPGPPGP